MRSPLIPFLLAAVVTVLIGIGVRMEPYFAGDVRIARAVQSALPDPGWWATPISRLAVAPYKHYVIAMTLAIAFVLAGWKGAAIAIAILLLEQYGAESTKALFGRPRPSRELIAVVGSPSGFSFPSTTMTFFAVTFGTLAVLAARASKHPLQLPVLGLGAAALVGVGTARVALGVHWPSDVILTAIVCLAWVWATVRVVSRTAS